jgi:hypothetical protein
MSAETEWFMKNRSIAVDVVQAQKKPPKGHHWAAVYSGIASDPWQPRLMKTVTAHGALVVQRETIDPAHGKFSVVERESGLCFCTVGLRRLAESVMRRHCDRWPGIVAAIEEGDDGIWRALQRLGQVYMRADPGEDDGGIAFEWQDPSPKETLGENSAFGLYEHPLGPHLFVLTRKADGSPRAWVRKYGPGWVRFDDGARDEDRHGPKQRGCGDVLAREFKRLKQALAASHTPKVGDMFVR